MRHFLQGLFVGIVVGGLYLLASIVYAGTTATPTYQGGTGINYSSGVAAGYLLIGNGASALATSSGLTYSTSANRLTATFASTTAITATTASSTNVIASNELRMFASAATNTPSVAGDTFINTNSASTSLRFSDGTSVRAVYNTFDKPTVYASSSLAFDGAYGASGTTTYNIWNPSHNAALTTLYCKTDTGTAYYEVGNGTASSTVQCTTSGASSNVTVGFALRQDVMEAVGHEAGNPNQINVTPTFRYDAD